MADYLRGRGLSNVVERRHRFDSCIRLKGTVKKIRGALIEISSTELDFTGFESLPLGGADRGVF